MAKFNLKSQILQLFCHKKLNFSNFYVENQIL